MLKPNKTDDGLAQTGQHHGAHEGARDGAREGEVVISGRELLMNVGRRHAVDQNIMSCLDVEGLLNLGVRGNDEVSQNEAGDEEGEKGVWMPSVTILRRSQYVGPSHWLTNESEYETGGPVAVDVCLSSALSAVVALDWPST